jgi:hypothetical protein
MKGLAIFDQVKKIAHGCSIEKHITPSAGVSGGRACKPSRGLSELHVAPRGRGLKKQWIALFEPYCGWFASFVRRKAHGNGTDEYYISFEAGEEQTRELSEEKYFRSTEESEEWSLPADEVGAWCLLEPRATGLAVTPAKRTTTEVWIWLEADDELVLTY